MSAPSELHEIRVGLLASMASLAGYSIDIQIYNGLRPDIARLNPSHCAIFIADAKATESPSNTETRARLLGYISSAQIWQRIGFAIYIAIGHGPDRAHEWESALRSLCTLYGTPPTKLATYSLDDTTWVTTAALPNHACTTQIRHSHLQTEESHGPTSGHAWERFSGEE
jgi:hypothetical protein